MSPLFVYPEDGFDVLSRQLWRLALAEVPMDEDEFTEQWASVVTYCNIYGSLPFDKHKEGFKDFPDPSKNNPTIPPTNHPYLNKLWHTRHQ